MTSFVEQAVLLVVDKSSKKIRKINTELAALARTADKLKRTKIAIAVTETGVSAVLRDLQRIETLAAKRHVINVRVNVTGEEQIDALLARLRGRDAPTFDIRARFDEGAARVDMATFAAKLAGGRDAPTFDIRARFDPAGVVAEMDKLKATLAGRDAPTLDILARLNDQQARTDIANLRLFAGNDIPLRVNAAPLADTAVRDQIASLRTNAANGAEMRVTATGVHNLNTVLAQIENLRVKAANQTISVIAVGSEQTITGIATALGAYKTAATGLTDRMRNVILDVQVKADESGITRLTKLLEQYNAAAAAAKGTTNLNVRAGSGPERAPTSVAQQGGGGGVTPAQTGTVGGAFGWLRGGVIGGAAGFLGFTVAHVVGRAIKDGFTDLDVAETRLKLLGLTPTEQAIAQAGASETSRKFPQMGRGASLGLIAESFIPAGNDINAAVDIVKQVGELVQLQTTFGIDARTAVNDAIALIRAGEAANQLTDASGAVDPMKVEKYIDTLQRGAILLGKEFGPSLVAGFFKYARASKFALDEGAILAGFLSSEESGTTASVGLNQAIKQLSGQQVMAKQRARLVELGLITDKQVKVGEVGGVDIMELVGDGAVDEDGLRRNFYKWVNDQVIPTMMREGFDPNNPVDVAKFAGQIVSNTTAQDSLTAAILRSAEISRQVAKALTFDVSPAGIFAIAQQSGTASVEGATAQLVAMIGEMTNAFEPAIIAVSDFTSSVAGTVARWIAEGEGKQGLLLPDAQMERAGVAAVTTVAAGVGALMLVGKTASALLGFGGAAGALVGAAGSLTAAAVKLGGPGVVAAGTGKNATKAGKLSPKNLLKSGGMVGIIALTAEDAFNFGQWLGEQIDDVSGGRLGRGAGSIAEWLINNQRMPTAAEQAEDIDLFSQKGTGALGQLERVFKDARDRFDAELPFTTAPKRNLFDEYRRDQSSMTEGFLRFADATPKFDKAAEVMVASAKGGIPRLEPSVDKPFGGTEFVGTFLAWLRAKQAQNEHDADQRARREAIERMRPELEGFTWWDKFKQEGPKPSHRGPPVPVRVIEDSRTRFDTEAAAFTGAPIEWAREIGNAMDVLDRKRTIDGMFAELAATFPDARTRFDTERPSRQIVDQRDRFDLETPARMLVDALTRFDRELAPRTFAESATRFDTERGPIRESRTRFDSELAPEPLSAVAAFAAMFATSSAAAAALFASTFSTGGDDAGASISAGIEGGAGLLSSGIISGATEGGAILAAAIANAASNIAINVNRYETGDVPNPTMRPALGASYPIE